jgi:hypothetical protein
MLLNIFFFGKSQNVLCSAENFLNSKIDFRKKYCFKSIGCSFKFPVKVGVEQSIVNALWITGQLFKSYRCLCFYTYGAFTIDSSTPTLIGDLNEHPI